MVKKVSKAKTKAKAKPRSNQSIAGKKRAKELHKTPKLPAGTLTKPPKLGNPTEYKPEFCDMLIAYMAKGFSLEAFCGHINATYSSVYRWLKHPDYGDFRKARKIGEAKQREFWEEVGKSGLMGNIKGFNTTVWIFNMKNRYGWNDKRVEDETKEFDSIVIELPNSKQQQVINMGAKDDDGIDKDIINVTPSKDESK